MKTKPLTIILFAVLIGCRKDQPVVVNNNNLTDCPAKATCTYNYYNNADFANWTEPAHGTFRLFWYKSIDNNVCAAETQLYFKTSMNDNDFDITSGQIASGEVTGSSFSCACCYIIDITRPIGGEIKGKKTGPDTWLVNARVIEGTSLTAPVDTLVINQYFTLK